MRGLPRIQLNVPNKHCARILLSMKNISFVDRSFFNRTFFISLFLFFSIFDKLNKLVEEGLLGKEN